VEREGKVSKCSVLRGLNEWLWPLKKFPRRGSENLPRLKTRFGKGGVGRDILQKVLPNAWKLELTSPLVGGVRGMEENGRGGA